MEFSLEKEIFSLKGWSELSVEPWGCCGIWLDAINGKTSDFMGFYIGFYWILVFFWILDDFSDFK